MPFPKKRTPRACPPSRPLPPQPGCAGRTDGLPSNKGQEKGDGEVEEHGVEKEDEGEGEGEDEAEDEDKDEREDGGDNEGENEGRSG